MSVDSNRNFVILLAVAGAVLAIGPLTITPGPLVADPGATWAVEGFLSDACQCHVFCPCELAEKPSFGHCNDTAIIHIERGHWAEVPLDGQRIVIVSKSPDGERLVDSVGRLDFAHMYVPEGASDAQMKALERIAHTIFGAWVENGGTTRISEHETLERVPMEVSIETHRHRVKIPDLLDLDIEAITGWDGENPATLINGPAAGEGMDQIVIARSNRYRYTGHGIDWDYGGRSASIRPLDLSGPVEPVGPAGPVAD